jgi:hypothetical protein
MGGCCGREYVDEKISSASTIAELAHVIMERNEEAQNEIKEIEAYLKNPTPNSGYAVN